LFEELPLYIFDIGLFRITIDLWFWPLLDIHD
jgi:hypothetical protein